MNYQYTTPRHTIIYHKDKCGNAYECLKCVETTNKVGCFCLGYMNTETPNPKTQKTYESIDWKVFPTFMPNCWGCEKCVKACPKDALELKMAEPRVPAVKAQRSDIIFCYTHPDGTKETSRDGVGG